MTTNEKIASLREKMKNHNIDAVIIPSADPHQSEYIANHWKDRIWISGFTGSAGVVIVTHDHAGVWTDSRYYLQAEKEIKGTEFELHKIINQFAPEHIDWLKENIAAGSRVAIHLEDFTKVQIDNIENTLNGKSITLDTSLDILSEVWNDRPELPTQTVFIHDDSYSGNTRSEKIAEMRTEMNTHNAKYYLLSALDEIAWLLNMRGSDIQYNPVFVSYCVINHESATLFIDDKKISAEVKNQLSHDGLNILPYEDIVAYLNNIPTNENVLIEQGTLNAKLYKAINGKIISKDSPARITKGIKTSKEVEHFRNTMVTDAIALAKSFKWLEEKIDNGDVTEYQFGEVIAKYRAEHAGYRGESFNPIVGYNGNGAIVHYSADKDNSQVIKKNGVLLVDCGGQYLGGTTDITRTFALSEVSDAAKKHYTLVLKGHIAMSQIIFPKDTAASSVDILARQFLWNEGLNYLHGTGHGIGYFLNVHEGPHGFAAPSTDRGRTHLKPGMLITNEPGFYLTNQYGIRIENIMAVKESKHQNFLEFETLTLYPYDLRMVDETALNAKEKSFINHYHKRVMEQVGPHLDPELKDWFGFRCRMLG